MTRIIRGEIWRPKDGGLDQRTPERLVQCGSYEEIESRDIVLGWQAKARECHSVSYSKLPSECSEAARGLVPIATEHNE